MAIYVRRGLVWLTIFTTSLIAIDGYFGAVRNGNTPVTGFPGALVGLFYGVFGFGLFGLIVYWVVRAIEGVFTIGKDKSNPKTHESKSIRNFQRVLVGIVVIVPLLFSLDPQFRFTNTQGTAYPTTGFAGILYTFITSALTFAIATVPIYWVALAIQWIVNQFRRPGIPQPIRKTQLQSQQPAGWQAQPQSQQPTGWQAQPQGQQPTGWQVQQQRQQQAELQAQQQRQQQAELPSQLHEQIPIMDFRNMTMSQLQDAVTRIISGIIDSAPTVRIIARLETLELLLEAEGATPEERKQLLAKAKVAQSVYKVADVILKVKERYTPDSPRPNTVMNIVVEGVAEGVIEQIDNLIEEKFKKLEESSEQLSQQQAGPQDQPQE